MLPVVAKFIHYQQNNEIALVCFTSKRA